MSELHFTIGLPRCGKSTFCDEWVRIKSSQPRVIVCSDNIRLALHGQRFQPKAENMVHSIQEVFIKALLDRGHDVIVDGTHTTLSNITRLSKMCDNIIPHYIYTDPEECKRRAVNSKQKDLLPIIDAMHNNLLKWNPAPNDILLSYKLIGEHICQFK